MNRELTEQLKEALKAYGRRNQAFPDHFILYRDGVGDAMREAVLKTEVV